MIRKPLSDKHIVIQRAVNEIQTKGCFRSDIPDHNLSDNLDLIQVITDLLSESNLVLLFNNLEFSRTNERGI